MFYILNSDAVFNNAMAAMKDLPRDGSYTVTISDKKKTCSHRQRNYWHELVGIIAEFKGEDKEALKTQLKYEWLELKEISARGKTYYIAPSTEKITRAQYSELIEKTLMLGDLLDVRLPSPSHFGIERI